MILYVILGRRCNLSCQYCTIKKEAIFDSDTISDKVFSFIEHEKPERVIFYGGEPFLYFDQIQRIVNREKEVKYTVITNGTLLDKEKVDYLNSNPNIVVTLSWDGANTLASRGVDVLKSKKDLLLSLNNLAINGVITTKSYPLDFLYALEPYNNEYLKRHDKSILVNMDMIMEDDEVSELSNFDEERFTDGMNTICKIYEEAVLNGKQNLLVESFVNNYSSKDFKPGHPFCDLGYGRVYITLNGQFIYCRGNNTVLGEYDNNLEEILEKTRTLDRNPKRYTGMCAECEVQRFCHNGCTLYSKNGMKGYCRKNRLLYKTICEMEKRINRELQKRGFKEEFKL